MSNAKRDASYPAPWPRNPAARAARIKTAEADYRYICASLARNATKAAAAVDDPAACKAILLGLCVGVKSALSTLEHLKEYRGKAGGRTA